MAKTTKYIVAANGTFHLRSPETGNSYCGRVRPDMNGVKLTNREPREGVTTCGRSAQLAARVPQAIQNGYTGTETASPNTGTRKGVKTPVRAAQGSRGTVRNTIRTAPNGTKVAVVTQEPDHMASLKAGLDAHRLYADVDTFLVANDADPTFTDGPDGLHITFEHDSWVYKVYAPEFNSNGPDDGWRIVYASVDGDTPDADVEDDLKTDQDVIKWLADDTGMKVPTVKQLAKVAANKRAAEHTVSVGTKGASFEKRATADVINASRITMETARNMYENAPNPDPVLLALFQSIIDAQVNLKTLLLK